MSAYLSVDVDYWRAFEGSDAFQKMDEFFSHIIRLKRPIFVVNSHQELLKDVNQVSFERLINVDFHSDLTCYVDRGEKVYEYHDTNIPAALNCGTWVNFVEGRQDREFIWIYPHDHCLRDSGRCEEIEGFWAEENSRESKYHNWGQITCKKDWVEHIPWDTVQAVGIALSCPWLYRELEDHFLFEIFPRLLEARAEASGRFWKHLIIEDKRRQELR